MQGMNNPLEHVMSETPELLLSAIETLAEQVRDLQMKHTVQQSSWLVLARHLSVRGFADLETLAEDLRQMSASQQDADWQAGFESLADALSVVRNLPSSRPR